MQQVLFHLPSWLPLVGGAAIYGYGVMLVIGFFGALQLAKFLAARNGIDPELFVNAGLIALVTGVAGARLSHVLENLGQYTDPHRTFSANLWDAVNIRSGGLTFYGGFLLATPCTIAYGLLKKIPIRLGMDIVAPCLMIGLGFGRVGCFLNGCCYGAECDLPWAVRFPYHSNAYLDEYHGAGGKTFKDHALQEPPYEVIRADKELLSADDIARSPDFSPVQKQNLLLEVRDLESNALHPAQLYSTITALLIAGLLAAYFTLKPIPGRVFALMLLVESPTRFILEMLRAEPPVVGRGSVPARLASLPPMSFSMVLSVGLFAAGVVLWFAFRRRPAGGETRAPALAAA